MVIGRSNGNGFLGVVVGLGAGVLALSVLALLGGAVSGISGYFGLPKSEDGSDILCSSRPPQRASTDRLAPQR